MLSLNNIKPTAWARKAKKRIWRWNASNGSYSGRWMNWQNSRSGGWVAPWFEWGQTPLFRRMPKLKGFSNAVFKKRYNLITFRDLELLAKAWITDVNKEVLLEKGLIENKSLWVKLVAKWDLTSKLNIVVDKASLGAIKAVEKASGKIEVKDKQNPKL